MPSLRLIKRSIRYWWQRRTRGWDDSETWSLDHTFHEWVVPRLKRFKEIGSDWYPCCFETREEWDNILDQMIDGFSQDASAIDDIACEKMQKAYDAFAKHHGRLWW